MERTVSGKAIAVGFVAVGLAVVLFVLFVSPGLQRQTDDLLGAERDVLDVGELEGVGWVVASEFDDGPACVVTEFEGREVARACAAGPLGEMAVAAPGDGGYLLTGAVTDVPQVRVELSDGQAPLPRVYRPGGSPAGYYVTTVPAGVAVVRVVGLDLDERELVVRTCYGPLATVDGISSACSDET